MKNTIDPVEILRERCSEHGAQTRFARTVGVGPAWISRLIAREKPIPDHILKELGLRRVVRYERIGEQG